MEDLDIRIGEMNANFGKVVGAVLERSPGGGIATAAARYDLESAALLSPGIKGCSYYSCTFTKGNVMNGEGSMARKRKKPNGHASVCLIVGGTFQKAISSVDELNVDKVVFIDVAEEAPATVANGRDDILVIPLACGETLGTLTAKGCSAGLKKFLAERPGVNLALGLGQLRAVGDIVASQLVENQKFLELLANMILAELSKLHHGRIHTFEISVFNSVAGATGSTVGQAVAKAVAAVIEANSDAIVTVRMIRVGSLSFSGLGDRVHINGAASIAETVDYVIDPDRHPREVRMTEFIELPMVGPQKILRDEYARQFLRAYRCEQVQEMFNRSIPNEVLDSLFGSSRIIKVSFYNPLLAEDVAVEVANELHDEIESLILVGAKAGIAEEITVSLIEEAVDLPSPQLLAEQIRRAKRIVPPGLQDHCIASPTRFQAEAVYVNVAGKMQTSLAALLSTSCRNSVEFTHKLGVLKAIQFHLARHVKDKSAALSRATAQLELGKRELIAILGKFFPSGWVDRCTSLITDPARNLIQFQNAVQLVRQRFQEVERIRTELNALSHAAAQVLEELTHEQDRIRRAGSVLGAIGDTATPTPLVRVGGVDEVLAPLLDEILEHNNGLSAQLLQTLSLGVTQVTMAGLAMIVGTPEPRPEQVAQTIARCEPTTPGPEWGGKRWLGRTTRILVLPPMDRDDVTLLRHLVGKLNKDLILVSADHAKGNLNAVLLEVCCPSSAEDIFTPFHVQHLRKACQAPELFFTNGQNGNHWLPEDGKNEKGGDE